MRECGILLPVFSLPSRYGIGCFSREAYKFVDDLKAAGQQYWQILPLGPTGTGDSPYAPFSAFAGNPYFIDLETLTEEGYLTKEECESQVWGGTDHYVDYGKLYEGRYKVLRLAYERFKKEEEAAGKNTKLVFSHALMRQTRDYCFYAALKLHFENRHWIEWDEDIRLRKPAAVKKYEDLLADDILFFEYLQYVFEKQWKKLKAYANEQGIRIIGDLPIYVAFDGSDCWSSPKMFDLDEENMPKSVAGCPPDVFAATGQLWGNPLYAWDEHRKTDYAWWMDRMEYTFRLYDKVRLDHFRAFASYYSIPAGDKTAENGVWKKGPGAEFFKKIKERFPNADLIAEDLGTLTPDVHRLMKTVGLPGMKILEFAFNSWERNAYLPMFHTKNSVVYTGTHDNDTLQGWFGALSEWDKKFAIDFMSAYNVDWKYIHWHFIRMALVSVADLAIIPMQDYLGLGSEARLNTPGTMGENWKWRMGKDDFSDHIKHECKYLAELYDRVGREEEDPTKEKAEKTEKAGKKDKAAAEEKADR